MKIKSLFYMLTVAVAMLFGVQAAAQPLYEHVMTVDRFYPNDGDCYDGTDFSRGMSGGLVFPSLSEFSTVYCDPHSQRLWHSQ